MGIGFLNPEDLVSARLHFADGRISTFRDQTLAYQTWLSLPRGVRAAFRGRGDHRSVYR